MSIFLDQADVKKLTGYEMASYQLKWCRNNGITAWLSAQGEVNIPKAAVEGRKAENDSSWTPDFSALRG